VTRVAITDEAGEHWPGRARGVDTLMARVGAGEGIEPVCNTPIMRPVFVDEIFVHLSFVALARSDWILSVWLGAAAPNRPTLFEEQGAQQATRKVAMGPIASRRTRLSPSRRLRLVYLRASAVPSSGRGSTRGDNGAHESRADQKPGRAGARGNVPGEAKRTRRE
jgi:hypothetical protein